MNIVLDTSVIISHLLSRGKNNTVEIFKMAKRKDISLISCKESLEELKKKLSSEKIKKYPSYRPNIIAAFVAWYQYNSVLFLLDKAFPQISVRDPTDIIYLQLAKISNAHYLITADNDLLSIHSYNNISIVTPQEFIERTSNT